MNRNQGWSSTQTWSSPPSEQLLATVALNPLSTDSFEAVQIKVQDPSWPSASLLQ